MFFGETYHHNSSVFRKCFKKSENKHNHQKNKNMKKPTFLLLLITFIFLHCYCYPTELSNTQNAINEEKKFKLLITGCGRSGTLLICHLLKQSGLNVGHETLEKDGIVSWAEAPASRSEKKHFKHVFHQVRHPLRTISSWLTNFPNLDGWEWRFIRHYIPEISKDDSLIIHCAKYWYYWNLLAENKSDWRYQVEKLEENFHEFEMKLGIEIDRDFFHKLPVNYHHYRDSNFDLSWQDLEEKIPSELYHKIRAMSLRYGYDLPTNSKP